MPSTVGAQLELLTLAAPSRLSAPIGHKQASFRPKLQRHEFVRINGDCAVVVIEQMLATFECQALPAVLGRSDLRALLGFRNRSGQRRPADASRCHNADNY